MHVFTQPLIRAHSLNVLPVLKRCVSTINIDKSVREGRVIPNLDIKDIGVSSIIGRRDYQEDRCSVKRINDDTLYLAIFDGHGGSLAVDYASQNLPSIVQSLMKPSQKEVADLLKQAFSEVNNGLMQHIRKHRPQKERFSGTTALVCLLLDNLHLHTAHVGDSRAILCRRGKYRSLTTDHTPDREDEMKRIESKGGTVISNSLGELRVNGRLSMTRSVGDFDLKQYGVTADPEYSYTKIKHTEDSFLVLATDGITQVMTNDEVVSTVSLCDTSQKGADTLTDSASQLRSSDNCSAIVVPLGAWGRYKTEDTNSTFGFNRLMNYRD